jgi:hypothetical protein
MQVTTSNIYKSIFVSVLLLVASIASAQGFYNSNAWRKQRHELRFEIGAANFLGDLGGRDRIGSNFLYDLELNQTKFATSFNYLYYLSEKVGLRTSINFGKVSGDDALTAESFRNNRNLKFESIILETGMSIEWHFLKEKPGNIYNVRSTTGRKLGSKGISSGFYVTAGVNAFYFNPKAEDANGSKVPLFPLKTEGQGLENGAKAYKRVSVAIPIGGGYRKNISRKLGIKIELAHRFTFTDYIDDVSTVYFDRNVLNSQVGGNSAYFSNPQLGDKPAIVTAPGQQRGDATDKDGYMFLTAGIYIKLSSGKKSVYGRNRVLKVKASF